MCSEHTTHSYYLLSNILNRKSYFQIPLLFSEIKCNASWQPWQNAAAANLPHRSPAVMAANSPWPERMQRQRKPSKTKRRRTSFHSVTRSCCVNVVCVCQCSSSVIEDFRAGILQQLTN